MPANRSELHRLIGHAIEAYAEVERDQADILNLVLGTKKNEGSIIFHSVQNVRARNEMIQALLRLKYQSQLKKFWAECSKFLFQLSLYRNGIVHGHPSVTVHMGTSLDFHPSLHNPFPGRSRPLKATDFPPFVSDCRMISKELEALAELLKTWKPNEALPQRFQQPTIRPNLAVLRPHQKPREPQPQRKPSRPKFLSSGKRLSSRQRREIAMRRHAKKK